MGILFLFEKRTNGARPFRVATERILTLNSGVWLKTTEELNESENDDYH